MKGLLTIAVLISCLLLVSCVSPNQETIRVYADDGYNFMLTISPKSILNSELMEIINDGLKDNDNDAFEKMLDWIDDEFELDLAEVDTLTLGMELEEENGRLGEPANFLAVGKGGIDDDVLENAAGIMFGRIDFEDDDHGEFELKVSDKVGKNKFAYCFARGYALGGLQDSVEDGLDTFSGKEKSLTSSRDYQDSALLLDPQAQASLLVWDFKDIFEVMISNLRYMPGWDKAGDDFYEAMAEMNSAGLSLSMKQDLVFTIRAKFDEKDAAEEMTEMLEDFVDLMSNEAALQTIVNRASINLNIDDLEEAVEDIRIRQEGQMVEILWVIPSDSAIFEFKSVENDEENAETEDTENQSTDGDFTGDIMGQTTEEGTDISDMGMLSEQHLITVANMEAVGSALEQYYVEKGNYPQVGSFKALVDLLVNDGFMDVYGEIKDGWGNDFIYQPMSGIMGEGYQLLCYGSDGQPGPQPVQPGIVTRPEEDIIWENGKFVQRPESEF